MCDALDKVFSECVARAVPENVILVNTAKGAHVSGNLEVYFAVLVNNPRQVDWEGEEFLDSV